MKNSNITQESLTRHFEWDYADRMRVFRNQISTIEPTVYSQYFYDAGGNRVMKFTRKQGGNWQWTVYIDGIFEWTQNSDAERQSIAHIMDDKSRIASVRNGDAMGDSTPEVKYNLEDHLGSSMTLLDDNGSWINWEEYYPFGETSLGSYAKKSYRYCGKERDEESGLYYYGARFYAPWLCRFASVDPLAAQSTDRTPYHYCSNNPLNRVDPDGMKDKENKDGDTTLSDKKVLGIAFDPKDKKASELYNEYKQMVVNRLESSQKKVNNLTLKQNNEGLLKAEKKDLDSAKKDFDTYNTILNELTELENADEVFKIRSKDFVVNKSGGGNISFNANTMEVDINLNTGLGKFNDIQKISHELKHAHQYLKNRLLLSASNGNGFNSRELETEAYERQNLFATNQYQFTDNIDEFVRNRYPKLNETNITALQGSQNYDDIMKAAKGARENPNFKMPLITYGWRNMYYGK